MKYKDIFKSWWFYVFIGVYFFYKVFTETIIYGKLFLVEYVGILLGSFIGILFFVSLIFLLIKLSKKIKKKVLSNKKT